MKDNQAGNSQQSNINTTDPDRNEANAAENAAQKVALITGAAQRIGARLAAVFHHQGYNLVIHYGSSAEQAQTLTRQLNQQRPESAHCIQADLKQLTEITLLAERAINHWGRLDLLINSASRFYPSAVNETTPEIWDDLINSNLRGPFFLSQAAAPTLAANRGNIINIVDIYAQRPLRGYPAYCISKAGLDMATKALARELGPKVRVNAIAPGAILWPENAAELSTDDKDAILERTALGVIGTPDDICDAAQFLANANYVTGQTIAVDGGRSLNQ